MPSYVLLTKQEKSLLLKMQRLIFSSLMGQVQYPRRYEEQYKFLRVQLRLERIELKLSMLIRIWQKMKHIFSILKMGSLFQRKIEGLYDSRFNNQMKITTTIELELYVSGLSTTKMLLKIHLNWND
jgi:hypothetical protein